MIIGDVFFSVALLWALGCCGDPSDGGRPVEFTTTEDELLRALSVKARRVVTHDALLRRVWARLEDASVQVVRNFVKKLRRKLGYYPAYPAPEA